MSFVEITPAGGAAILLDSYGALIAHDGWGMPPQRPLLERGPMQNGATWRDYRLDPRIGTLVIRMRSTELADMYSLRNQLINSLKPGSALELSFNTGLGLRIFDAYYNGEFSGEWNAKDWAAQRIAINFFCPDPTCRGDAGEASADFGAGAVNGEIPMSVPMIVGSTALNGTMIFDYDGNAPEYPIITIEGPVTDAVVTNTLTGDKLDFTGATIVAGDYYRIDTRYGYKAVTDKAGNNQIDKLSAGSDLATFSIRPTSGGAPPYTQIISMTGGSIGAGTRLTFVYDARYLGI